MLPPPGLRFRFLAIHVLAWALCSVASAQVASVPSRETVQQRLSAVSTLIESSSGAKQVESSGNREAQSARAAARVVHRSASTAFQEGDNASASALLGEASKMMFDAVRLAAPEQVTAGKDRLDFDSRMESTRALLEAQRRIDKEKSGGTSGDKARNAEASVARANKLADSGDLKAARVALDEAYLTIAAAVRGLRSGDTLVRSLNFADKAEEYRYELDRNETHLMLVTLLLAEKRASAQVDAMVRRALDEAGRLRKLAEASATGRDFDGGVRALESSTRELVRAIRGAGVYIPG